MRRIEVRVDGRLHVVEFASLRRTPVEVWVDGEPYLVELEGLPERRPHIRSVRPRRVARTQGVAAQSADARTIVAPMVGKVVSVSVVPGETVEPGTQVCVLEAMKMEQAISCSLAGVVQEVRVKPGDNVSQGDVLVVLE